MATVLERHDPEAEVPSRRVRGAPRALVILSELSWRLLVCVAAFGLVAYALWQVKFVFLPVFIALLVATVLAPPARALRAAGLPNALAATLSFLGALAVVALVIRFVAPEFVHQVGELGTQVEAGVEQLGDYVASGPFGLSDTQVQGAIDAASERVRRGAGTVASGVVSGVTIVGQILTQLLLTLVLVFFFVKDGGVIWRWILRLFPRHRRNTVQEVGETSWRILGHYMRGVSFVACVDAVFIGLALAIIGVPLVIPLAVLTFLAAFIPFVGAVVAGAAAALVALVSNGPIDALLVVGAVLLVQQIEGNLLYPVVVGRSLELHPVAILLAVGVGSVVAGILGAFIAVPIVAVLAAAIPVLRRETEEDRREEELMDGQIVHPSG
ncbi:MAG: AI-2E family transporter [Actinomycetota bacterium]|nr:AI-2E family transporter [Actinomycetota bacterium]